MPENEVLLFDVQFEPFDSCAFHCWSDLPNVLKIKILQYLPYPTIRQFMFLSKECYMLASNTRTQAEIVQLREQWCLTEYLGMPGERNRLDLVVCWMPPDKQLLQKAHKRYRLSFVKDSNGGCYVEKITKRKGRVSVTTGVHYDEDTYTTAMRVLFNIAKSLDILTVKIQLRSLNPQIERVLKEEPSSTTLCSNTFEIRTEDNTLVSIFLRFLRPKCRLVIFCHGIIDLNKIFLQTSFFDSDIVRAARDIFVDVRSGITDDQVTKLQAPTFRINSPYLSAWSINKLILQWLEGKREIISVSVSAAKDLPKREVFQGIDPSALLPDTEPSYGRRRPYDPALYTMIRSDHGDLRVYLPGNYCILSDPLQSGH